ncbi:MAG: SpoIIE family protein phosphatase, partial [Chloroflexia bacterium]|nr:SpoIIE family protein phosphatase [Chloroflexia bacterium]
SKAEIINNDGTQEVELSNSDKILLKHDDLTLTIEFSALDFTNPDKNQYAYMIEGQNQNWINIGNRRFVSFTNLAEGKHILRIKGANNDGVWNENGISITIIKNPPWWRTTAAYLTYFILLIAGIFFFIKLRERNLVKEKRILEERVAFRTKEISRQKEEILAQRDEIQTQMELVSEQRNKISQQNNALTDSILYAKRIQTAVLPSDKMLNELLPNYFTLFLPRDIVSGDFYWAKKVQVKSDAYIYFTVADCTGHGVPGGFVSMLSITLLNEIIRDEKDYTPAYILNQLRELIKSSLRQSNEQELKDGLDMSLCLYKPKTKELHFAGANSFIYHVSNHELTVIKGDNMPVATYFNEAPFTNHVIQLNVADTFYLFSDGYLDQFGGKKNQKFMRRNFKELIFSLQDMPFEKQKEALHQTLLDWKRIRHR